MNTPDPKNTEHRAVDPETPLMQALNEARARVRADGPERERFPVLGRLPIMPVKCHTCVWQTNGHAIDLNPGRKEEIEAYLREGTTHQCHHTGPHSRTNKGRAKKHTCRGSVEYMQSIGIHDESDRVAVIIQTVLNNRMNRGKQKNTREKPMRNTTRPATGHAASTPATRPGMTLTGTHTLATGSFGGVRPDGGTFTSAVHIVSDGQALCGYRPVDHAMFSWNAHGVVREFVGCQRCLEKHDAQEKKAQGEAARKQTTPSR